MYRPELRGTSDVDDKEFRLHIRKPKKEFEDISVREIADEAALNRNTFYLHYPDKSALLRAMTDVRFRDLIECRGISFTDCDGARRAIALGVCDYLTEITNRPIKGARIPLEAPSSRSSRACSRKALAIMRWHPVSMRHGC
jgi:AcrR family transcriptional regulator